MRCLAVWNAVPESGSYNSERLYALVNDIVVPHLDMPRIERIVLGKFASLVTNYRSEFTLILGNNGFEALITQLRNRNGHAQLAAK